MNAWRAYANAAGIIVILAIIAGGAYVAVPQIRPAVERAFLPRGVDYAIPQCGLTVTVRGEGVAAGTSTLSSFQSQAAYAVFTGAASFDAAVRGGSFMAVCLSNAGRPSLSELVAHSRGMVQEVDKSSAPVFDAATLNAVPALYRQTTQGPGEQTKTMLVFSRGDWVYEFIFANAAQYGSEKSFTISVASSSAPAAAGGTGTGELDQESRDTARISDMSTLKSTLALYLADTTSTGAEFCPVSRKIYRSDQGTRKVDGTGWLPVNFTKIPGGSPLSFLPQDPVNSDKLHYSYACDAASLTFELNADIESQKYGKGGRGDLVTTDGGDNPNVYEVGTAPGLTLIH